jgi:conserved hypothetical integral membrane protein TIGR02206
MERVPFFGAELAPFTFYSTSHWVSLMLIAAACALTLGWREPRERPRLANAIRHVLAALLLLFDIALHVWYFAADQWDPSWTLPLHLCSLTLILSFIMLWTKSYRLFEFNYFAGIGGALQALLTPAAILSGYPHFTFFYFFVAHGGIIVSSLFMIAAYGYRPRLSSVWRTMLWLNVLLIPIGIVNYATGGNYMFIARKPAYPSLLDLLGPWPWYIVSLEGVALIMCLILYLPFAIRPKREVATSPHEKQKLQP